MSEQRPHSDAEVADPDRATDPAASPATDAPPAGDSGRVPRLRRVLDPVVSTVISRLGVVYVLTFVTYIISPPRNTPLVARIAAGVALALVPWLVTRPRLRSGVLGALLLIAAWGPLTYPFLDLDNHHVLTLYWLLALLLTGMASDPVDALGRAARWVLALVFVFATLWKLLVPDFVDGSFLTYLLATDARIDRVAAAVDWHDPQITADNRQLVGPLRHDPLTPLEPTELEVPERSMTAGPLLALGTILVEGAVALAYALPLRGRWRWLRGLSLTAFLLTTYGLLPVYGFGALLAVMGLAASGLAERRAIVAYLGLWSAVGALAWISTLLGG